MCRKQPHIIIIALVAVCVVLLNGLSYAAVTRTVSGTACNPDITITVTPDAGTLSYAYEEYIYGLTPSAISENGSYIPGLGVIRWGAFLDDTVRSFSYTLSGSDGTYSISGRESQDGKDTDTDSTPVTIDCTPPQVASPVFDPSGGTDVPVTVTITTTIEEATIYFTTDGTTPTTSSEIYTDPIPLNDRAILRAIAVKSGMADSDVSTAVYNIPYVPPAQTLSRSISGTICRPVVSISIIPTIGTLAYAIEETLSSGLVPENISHSGIWDEGASTIRWGIFLDGDSRTLSYELTGPDASYSLSGTGSFDGRNQDITGTTQVEIDCIPEQAAAPVIDPPSGTRVPLTITMTTITDGAEIRYTTDGTEPDETSTLYTAPIRINTAETVKARSFKTGLAPSDTTQADYLSARRPMAIIVAGGGPFEGNTLWPATKHVSNYTYRALLYQGYAKEDIQFLSPDLSVDVDGNGELDDIDTLATRENLDYALTTWASNAEELLCYFTGHGGDKTFMLGQNDILNAADLAGWLDTLQETMTGRVIVIYDACQSGTFLPEMIPPEGKERVVITSASNEPALFLEGGVLSFSYQFWTSIFLTGSIYEAYLTGSQLMINDQRPLLDVDGNGIANEKTDKIMAGDIIIGRGMLAASVPPEIGSVSGDQILTSSNSATIWAADITSLDPISSVWAVIIPPDYHPESVDIPITVLPKLEMTDQDEDGQYEGTYSLFTLHGTYRLLIYARDNQGGISLPRETRIIQQGGEISPNNPPVAQNMSFSTDEDTSIQGTLSASDADGDTLSYIVVSDGAIGTVSITDVNTGAFIYHPHTNEHGADSFTFKVNDGTVDSDAATVSITINPVEDAPQASAMSFTVERNSSLNDILSAADGDGDSLTFAIESQPAHGGVVLDDPASGIFTYTPDADYFGADSFTFTANDGKAASAPATVSITIERGYNNPPSAANTSFNGTEDIPFSNTLQGSDPDSDPLTFILVSNPVKGVVELTDPGTGAFTYTPYADLNGEDSFIYKVSDGLAESGHATCTVSIAPVNDAPVAKDGSLSVTSLSGAGEQLSASDPDNDALTFSIALNGQMGQAVITNTTTGDYNYTPNSTENGVDRFTFTANDGQVDSGPAEIIVNIHLPQAEIIRSFSGDGCMIAVGLSVTPVATVKAYALEEHVPESLIPDSISDNGIWDDQNRVIRWGVFLDNASRTLTYTLTGDDGDYELTGTGSFDGWNQQVGGDSLASIACGAQRVAIPVFDPPSGTRVPVDVYITSDTIDAQIRYTTDGTTPTSTSDLYTPPLHLNEPVTIKARAFKEGMYDSQTAEARYRPTRSHKAIIVAGGSPDNYLWPATKLVSEYAYKALLYQGYDKEDIMFLSAVVDLDIDGNGQLDDIDGLATSSALEEAITTWALDAESLLLFMTDHGGLATFNLSSSDILGAVDLDTWLDTLQGNINGTVIVVYDACQAGTFLENLIPPPEKARIVITSAADERAWFINEGVLSFSYQFWASIFGKANIYDAFDAAKRIMHGFQTALLDANGDGIDSGDEDWLVAKDVIVGRGAVAAGVSPEISNVSSVQVLDTGTSATIAAWDIISLNDIERVWAIIVPPGYSPDDLDIPVTKMAEIDLTDQDGDGVYGESYDGFTSDGIYNIVIYAQDSEGLLSEPMQTLLIRGMFITGDLNGDGNVNLADAIIAMRMLSGETVTGIRSDYVISGIDVNGDSKIGMHEVIYILQKVSELR